MDNELRLRRILKGIRQQDVALKVGISQAQLSNIETGYTTPSAELFARIKQAIEELDGKA